MVGYIHDHFEQPACFLHETPPPPVMSQIATKRDLLDLKGELSEKVFNSTMRFGKYAVVGSS